MISTYKNEESGLKVVFMQHLESAYKDSEYILNELRVLKENDFDKGNNMISILNDRISDELVPLLENIGMNESVDSGLTSDEIELYNKELRRINYERHDWERKYNNLAREVQFKLICRFKNICLENGIKTDEKII